MRTTETGKFRVDDEQVRDLMLTCGVIILQPERQAERLDHIFRFKKYLQFLNVYKQQDLDLNM